MTVPYLIGFTPYRYVGEQCQSIEDMVSVSLQQPVPVSTITYNIGSYEDVSIPIQIKNLTNNTELTVSVVLNKQLFVINGIVNQEMYEFILMPEETREILISLNNAGLDATSVNGLILNSNISILVKNIKNDDVVTRNIPVSKIQSSFLNETIPVSS